MIRYLFPLVFVVLLHIFCALISFPPEFLCVRFRRVGNFNNCWSGTVCNVAYSVFYWMTNVGGRNDEVGGD